MDNNESGNSRPVELEYVSKTQPPPFVVALPLEPKVKKSLWRMFFWAVGLLFFLFVYAMSISGMLGIVVFHLVISMAVLFGAGLGSILLLVLAFRLINKRRVAVGILCLFLFLGSLPYLLIFTIGIFWSSWTPIDTLTTPDGKQYVLLSKSSIFDRDYALGTLESDIFFLKTYNKLASGNAYEGEFSLYTLIRPEPLVNQPGFRFFVQNNLIGIKEKSEYVFLLYDLKTQKRIYPDEETISPWILMDEQCEVHQADEAKLIKYFSENSKNNQVLYDALNHPNPNVRESARRVMGALNMAIPATQP